VGRLLDIKTAGAKQLILGALIVLIIIGGLLLFFNTASTSRPMLVFKGYEISATNTNAMAKLELRNTTGRDIWLCYRGSRPPFGPQFLERSTASPSKPTNLIETSLRVHLGFSFIEGKKVLPGDSVPLEFPLNSGESAKQVGVIYYCGRFSDSADFVSRFWKPNLDSKANWKEKAAFYWRRLTGKFKTPERHEISCDDLLSFEAAITNSPPK
jgi:hypothetical protein